jgi:GTPase SAR1 family protein
LLNELKNKASVDIKIVLIRNKIDLEDERKIYKEEIEKYSQENNFNLFFETSVKNGFNAKEVFMECSKILFFEKQKYNKINNSFENNDDKNIKIDIKKNEKRKGKNSFML